MKATKRDVEHYVWGEDCDGWRLLDRSDLALTSESEGMEIPAASER